MRSPVAHDPRRPNIDLRFTPQQGPSSDTALGRPNELYAIYADNLYPEGHPFSRLRSTGEGASVIARPYNRAEAPNRVVIVCGRGFMVDLVEKPDEFTARGLERQHGPDALVLSERTAAEPKGRRRAQADHAEPCPDGDIPRAALVLNG